jgi:SAM-dependent methyltransferase
MRRASEKITNSAGELYTRRAGEYVAFVSAFRHQDGIAAVLARAGLLHGGMRVLDAGCGTGFATFALLDACRRRGLVPPHVDAFDLTPAMLARFAAALQARSIRRVTLRQADVLKLDELPADWTGYTFVISVSMLEYVPPARLSDALRALRERLAPDGRLLCMITRKNVLTRWLIERWWQAHRYTRAEVADAFARAGFRDFQFTRYPASCFWLNFSNHVVIAR